MTDNNWIIATYDADTGTWNYPLKERVIQLHRQHSYITWGDKIMKTNQFTAEYHFISSNYPHVRFQSMEILRMAKELDETQLYSQFDGLLDTRTEAELDEISQIPCFRAEIDEYRIARDMMKIKL